jgi:hypothetical protein
MAEGYIFSARYRALSKLYLTSSTDPVESYDADAFVALDKAQEILDQHPGITAGLAEEIDSVKRLINDGVFYQPVTNKEWKAIVTAMASEFHGTGYVSFLYLISAMH